MILVHVAAVKNIKNVVEKIADTTTFRGMIFQLLYIL